jgi:hypothetical protein
MNEEQAVLSFFAKPENLPLALSVAEQVDDIRVQMNSLFWQSLQQRLMSRNDHFSCDWRTIEDRNQSDLLVGLQCGLQDSSSTNLFPMMEQQYLGGAWRIFFGLMWQTAPTIAQLTLPDVAALKSRFAATGFKQNENFIAWQWSTLYPRRRDFLQRFAFDPEKLLDEAETILSPFLLDYGDEITRANVALSAAPRSMAISLDQLRRKRAD